MQTIALQPVPAQQVQCVLTNQNGLAQNCQIAVYLRGTNLYVDLIVAGNPISYAVLAGNMTSLVPSGYFGFSGTLAWLDTQGSEPPQYTGLGSRWVLLYLTTADFAAIQGAS